MWRNATESVVEKLLQDWDLTEDKVPENDCSVPDAATVFSGRDDLQHHQLLDGVDVAHWSGFAVFTQASDPGRRMTGTLA